MPGRLGPRFALEAVFLIALAVAMGLADLTATAIVVVMAIAWLLVAIVEWLASRDATGGGQTWGPPPGAGWSDEHEPVTELVRLPEPVPEPAPEPEVDEDTGAPLVAAAATGERQRWYRRRSGGEDRRTER